VLDSKPLLSCPGKIRRTLLAGEHLVVASMRGFLTHTRPLVLSPGSNHSEVIKLVSIESAVETRRRWKTWKPWTVVAGGAGVALLGGGLMALARSDMQRYSDSFAQVCPEGCPDQEIPESVSGLETRAKLENTIGISALALGGAGVAVGVVLVVLNRPYTVQTERVTAPSRPAVTLTPLGPSRVPGVLAHLEF
jgi:hypothetical protein